MPRVQDKKEAVNAKPQNPFAALAESDSDVDSPPAGPAEPVVAPQAPQSPPMRSWPAPERNGFSSPFSRKRWNKPRFKEENDGWVSIRWNQPQFQEEASSANSPPLASLGVKYQPRTPTFTALDPDAETKVLEDDSPLYTSITPPSELIGPLASVVLENTITPSTAPQEQLTALAWAEKVKQSLEKAEAARASKVKDAKADEEFKEALGRLSFFRRGMVATSPAGQE
jgi:hypothetical protein